MTASTSSAGPFKYFAFLKRRAGLSTDEFLDQWENGHARFFADTPEVRRHIRRYELYPRIAGDEDRARTDVEVPDAGFDGVAVQWFDTRADLQALQAEPSYQAFAAADQPDYRDPLTLGVLTRAPEVIVGPPGGRSDAGMSLICILRRKAGLELGEFHDHWLHHHGGLFQTIPELHDPLLGYEQNHGTDLPDAAFDGVTQQWFASLPAWVESLQVPSHRDVVEPDVASFLDLESMAFIVATPPIVVIA